MSNYTEGFTSVSGDTVDSTELETEFDAIAAAIATKLDSDGSGTLTGVLNMGSNKITNVTDPTAAQHAATKNYVDTLIVHEPGILASTPVSSIETNVDTVTLNIPSAWNGYYLVANGSYNIEDNGAVGTASITVRVRLGFGTGGAAFAYSAGGVGITAPDTVVNMGLFGTLTGQTLTGSVDCTLTSITDAQSGLYNLNNVAWAVTAYRTS